ncbi:MAG: right-handed parallel beta-helix repeat-containing protein, partial [Ignavibacteriaceae bacterium]|nr:right-handed parallel beta-helix repeat-containing protein [Ignavibacteriaceae bacterium]
MRNRNKKYYQTFFLLLIFLTAYSLQLNATVRFVSKTGLSIPPYTSWETAADSIQKCINICVFGDTIYVANGVYEEQVVMINGLSLIGAGTDSCVVDSRQLVTLQNYKTIDMKNNCLVKGLYILSSNDFDYGYGIYTEAQSGLITLNKFSNANSGIELYGSNVEAYKNYCFNVRTGISVANSNSIVRKNELFMTSSTGAGVSGIFITAFSSNYQPIIDSNCIISNYGRGVRKSIGASPIIKNNLIQFIQYGAEGIFLSTSDSTKIYNNLIIIGTGQIGIDNNDVVSCQVLNNYIFGGEINSPQGIYVSSWDTVKNNVVTNTTRGIVAGNPQNLVVKYNNLWNNEINYTNLTPDTTNLSVDPMIVNDDTTQGDLDFHLQMYSPLIDAGDPTILDRDGSRSDIGLYGGPYGWTYTYQDLAPRPPHNVTATIEEGLVKLT